jgi:hypothetical protein
MPAQKKRADRYTVMIVDPRDLPERITAARQLGLHWFAEDYSSNCALHLFFDDAGRRNYLAGQYGSVVDDIRDILATVADGQSEDHILEQIRDLVFP